MSSMVKENLQVDVMDMVHQVVQELVTEVTCSNDSCLAITTPTKKSCFPLRRPETPSPSKRKFFKTKAPLIQVDSLPGPVSPGPPLINHERKNNPFDFDGSTGETPITQYRLNRKRLYRPHAVISPKRSTNRPNGVGYVYSPSLLQETNRLPKVPGRAYLVHALIHCYDLIQKMTIIPAHPLEESEMTSFHSVDYINYIKKSKEDDSSVLTNEEEEEFGLGYDCPVVNDLISLIRHVAGATVSAVNSLINGDVGIAINWCGGWHHGMRDSASGFCYTNDVSFGILHLLKAGYKRILYIDYDLHHGDGVEDSFKHSNKVITLSFHKAEIGFFPGTGVNSEGNKINVPFRDGLCDQMFDKVSNQVTQLVIQTYHPDFIIIQCGADSLAQDPMMGFCLTVDAVVKVVKRVVDTTTVPLLILGGGGYNHSDTARLWTSITGSILNMNLPNDIPEHDNLMHFGPTFELSTDPGLRKDSNTEEYVTQLLQDVGGHILKHHGNITNTTSSSPPKKIPLTTQPSSMNIPA